MKPIRTMLLGGLLLGSLCSSRPLLADEPGRPKEPIKPKIKNQGLNKKPVVSDVALDKKGVLHGIVVDAQGVPAAEVVVRVMREKREVIQLETDKMGRFAVTGLKAGLYRVVAIKGSCICRIWAPESAPPSASDGVLVVSRSNLLRAQYSPGDIFASDRFLLGSAVVGAAAVPVAIYSNRGSGS